MRKIEEEQLWTRKTNQKVGVLLNNVNHRRMKKKPPVKAKSRLQMGIDEKFEKTSEEIVSFCQKKVRAMDLGSHNDGLDNLVIKASNVVSLTISHMTPNRQTLFLKNSCQMKPSQITKAANEMIVKCIEAWNDSNAKEENQRNTLTVYREHFLW